ncbi:MAG: hypothetical protein WA667_29795 [Candidatus Nitrosopolaris sp.]
MGGDGLASHTTPLGQREKMRIEREMERRASTSLGPIVYEFSTLFAEWPPSKMEDLLFRLRRQGDIDPKDAEYLVRQTANKQDIPEMDSLSDM